MRFLLGCAAAFGTARLALAGVPGVHVVQNVGYVENGDPAQVLELYLPDTPSAKPMPLIIWIHGGAWSGGNLHNAPSQGFVRDGYAAASIEYRFTQKAKFPAQIQDCQAAIRWLRANAKTYNIDPDRFGAWANRPAGIWSRCWARPGGKRRFPRWAAT